MTLCSGLLDTGGDVIYYEGILSVVMQLATALA